MFKGKLAAAAVVSALAMTLAFGVSAYAASDLTGAVSTTASPSAELAKVQERFPSAASVLEATNDDFAAQLKAAGQQATADAPVIVHATGTIKVHATQVPTNVLLVGESSTTYVYDGPSGSGNVLRMKDGGGSIFGGTFNGGGAYYNIWASNDQATGANGYIEDVTITSGKMYGIAAVNRSSGIKVAGCTVTGVGDCGIQATGGSTIDSITGCTITKVGESGIDLILANVTTIKGNTIKGSKGHGISTDSEHASAYPQQSYCMIGSIENNVISGSVHHGIYLENKCTANSIRNNKVFNNTKAGICLNAGGVAKKVVKNDVYGNGVSNFSVSGSKAVLTMGANNKSYKSKHHGISASAGGRVNIAGANNKIYNNAKSGINAVDGAVIVVKGANTLVYGSGQNNVVASGKKAVVKVTGAAMQTYKAKGHGVSASAGGKVTITGANCAIRDNGHNGANVSASGSAVTFTGKGLSVKNNAKNGVSFGGGATGTVKNAKFAGNKVLAVYVGTGCKFTYGNCNISDARTAANRVYYA